MTDMATVGAFAYNIEATESMSRVMSYFLQQKIDLRDQDDIGSWLTRFKELDLRLVHWKMLLPQKWKANPNLTRHVPLMDPNLTTAHVTHNASMILLHQPIAYPPSHWGFRNRLPSGCSAQACYSAGVEIATITHKYLAKSPAGSPLGIQYAFCLFIAARMLLAHWRYTPKTDLSNEFWSILENLAELSHRWRACREPSQLDIEQDLFTKYANRLRYLYEHCAADENYTINVMDFTIDVNHDADHQFEERFQTSSSDWLEATQALPLQAMQSQLPHSTTTDVVDYENIPLLDQDFIEMDRIIAFDDGSMFTAAFDPANPW